MHSHRLLVCSRLLSAQQLVDAPPTHFATKIFKPLHLQNILLHNYDSEDTQDTQVKYDGVELRHTLSSTFPDKKKPADQPYQSTTKASQKAEKIIELINASHLSHDRVDANLKTFQSRSL